MAWTCYSYWTRPVYHWMSGSSQMWQPEEGMFGYISNELVLFPKKRKEKKTFTVLLNICIRSKRWSSSVYLSISFLLIGFWTPFFPQQVLTAWTLGLTVGPGHWWRQRDSSLCAQTCLHNRNSETDSMLTQKRERPRIQNTSNNHVYNM